MCKSPLEASLVLHPPPFVSECISQLVLRCDHYVSPLQGCQKTVRLSELKTHVSQCTHGKLSTPPFVSMSTTVADVLNASPRKLDGDAAERLTAHLVASKSKSGILQVKSSGPGPSQTFERVTKGRVGSDSASSHTVQRRSSELERKRETVCAGTAGAQAQHAAELRSMSTGARDSLLAEAGIGSKSVKSGMTLSLQSDLNMPWSQLRNSGSGWLLLVCPVNLSTKCDSSCLNNYYQTSSLLKMFHLL